MRTWKRTTTKTATGETKTTYTSDEWMIKSEISHNIWNTSRQTRFAVYKNSERITSFDKLKDAKKAIENGWV